MPSPMAVVPSASRASRTCRRIRINLGGEIQKRHDIAQNRQGIIPRDAVMIPPASRPGAEWKYDRVLTGCGKDFGRELKPLVGCPFQQINPVEPVLVVHPAGGRPFFLIHPSTFLQSTFKSLRFH